MWLFASGSAFITGVAIAATHDPLWALVLCPVVGFAFLLSRATRATIGALGVCVVAFLLLGVTRYGTSVPEDGAGLVSSYNGRGDVWLRAVIAEEPEQSSRYTQVLLDDIAVVEHGSPRLLEGRVLITTPDPRPLHYGDTVLLHDSLEQPASLGNFDYAGYLARKGVYSTMFCHTIDVLPATGSPGPRRALLSLNRRLGEAMARLIPEPESSLAQSLLLGRRGGMPDSLLDAFTRTGTAHLLSISGLHLAVVAAGVLAVVLAAMGRRRYLYVWFGIAMVWTYAVFTGMRPPVVRAAIMLTLFLLAELAGRQKHAPTALALAAALMVGVEPQLLWQTSFQLSVLAMAGLVLLYSPIRALLARCAALIQTRCHFCRALPGAAADITAATLAATVAILPVSAGTFGLVSAVAVPASLLTLPVLPFALVSASAAAVVALASPVLAAPFAWVAWLFLSCIINAVELLASAPGAATAVQAPDRWAIAGYYVSLVALAIVWQHSKRRDDEPGTPPASSTSPRHQGPRWAVPSLSLVAVLVWSAALDAPDGQMHVVFLDVGQGDSAFIVTPSGRTVLVDGGPDGQQTCSIIDRFLPFWDRSIDAVVMTHPHADHLGGLLAVADRYQVGILLHPGISSDSPLLAEWERRIAVSGIPRERATAGQELALGDGATLTVLNPSAGASAGGPDADDNNGVVLKLSYGDVRILFCADIRAEQETTLLHRGAALEANVLKVPHHGSDTSSSPRFLAAVDPDVAIVSVGTENAYGHPHDSVIEALSASGATTLMTATHGTIEFVTDGHELMVRTERPARAGIAATGLGH